MTTLAVGASGATGKLLVEQLLLRGEPVKAVLRSPAALPPALLGHPQLTVVQASLLDLSDGELAALTRDCRAVVSCLGHNLSFKGIYGQPRKLVTLATQRLCLAIRRNVPSAPVKFVLMNTAGNRNRDIHEPLSLAHRGVMTLIRALLPPQADNEAAADYLRRVVGQCDSCVTWVVVRPDSLIDQPQVSAYEVCPSPTRSAIFNAGQTSRVNVADFMAALVTDDPLWQTWRGRMPVIYNREPGTGRE